MRQIQLPGGVVLKSMPFTIVAYNDDGTPKLFELQPAGPHDMSSRRVERGQRYQTQRKRT